MSVDFVNAIIAEGNQEEYVSIKSSWVNNDLTLGEVTRSIHFQLIPNIVLNVTVSDASYDYNFSEAKNYIQSQLKNNYSEDGLNEMWVIMLAYMAKKEGDLESAQDYVSRQSKMPNPINRSWAKRSFGILDENPKFKEDFFSELEKMGITLQ